MSKKKLFIFILYTLGVFAFASVFLQNESGNPLVSEMSYGALSSKRSMSDVAIAPAPGGIGGSMGIPPENRMSTLDTSISIYVKDVSPVIKEVQTKAESLGGFVVSKNESRPTEGGHGYLSVRIPRDGKNAFLDYIRSKALTVLSVTESGNDITAQFYDAQARINSLEETMRLLRESQAKATTPKDIADIAIQMNQIQEQIDYAKGQAEYLQEASATVLVTVDLQTDEYALPYDPADGWSPEKVFKNAVRALNLFVRSIGSMAIWAVVFAPVVFIGFVVLYLAGKVFDKFLRRTNKIKTQE